MCGRPAMRISTSMGNTTSTSRRDGSDTGYGRSDNPAQPPLSVTNFSIPTGKRTTALVNALQEFQSLGVDFISYQEHIDTTTPQGELIFMVMASLAQFESALMSERVKAGMARAKAQGKRISRAPLARSIQTRIARLYAQGTSISFISKQLGIGYGTAWNYVQRLKATETGTKR